MRIRIVATTGHFILALAFVATLGCKSEDSTSSNEQKTTTAPEKASSVSVEYTAHGIIKAKTADKVTIHHEAIPDFAGRNGKKTTMMSMSMPFGLPKELDAADFPIGTPIKFVFTVDFDRKPALMLVQLEKLPADTQLKLSGM